MKRPSRTASSVRVFLFSVGVRNHWLGVIPRGRFDPMSHYLYLPGHPLAMGMQYKLVTVLLLTSTEFFEDFEAILYEFFHFPTEIRLKNPQ
jgi:hypothetical protein